MTPTGLEQGPKTREICTSAILRPRIQGTSHLILFEEWFDGPGQEQLSFVDLPAARVAFLAGWEAALRLAVGLAGGEESAE